MKYIGMPLGMWLLYKRSFRKHLQMTLGCTKQTAKAVTKNAKPKYKAIIARVPEFEKEDRFKMNLVNCALLTAFVHAMEARPTVEALTQFYGKAMMNAPTRWFCRMSAKQKFTEKDSRAMEKTAALRAADRNPYSWNMDFLPYPDGSSYEARFTTCGICTLMREEGLFDLVPAMCRLDYTMNDAGGRSDFVRRYTLASGGPYCDCGYRKKEVRTK